MSENSSMNIDERIEKLVYSMERLQESQVKTGVILGDVLDSIKRLERIAIAHEVRLQDTEGALARLEARRPQ